MPHSLARLPLTALATGLAAGAALAAPQARAAEPVALPPALAGGAADAPFIAYVLDGLDGPDFATAPSAGSPVVPEAPRPIRYAMSAPLVPAIFASPFAAPVVPSMPLAELISVREPDPPSAATMAPELATAFVPALPSAAAPVAAPVPIAAALAALPPLPDLLAAPTGEEQSPPASPAAVLPQGPMADGSTLAAHRMTALPGPTPVAAEPGRNEASLGEIGADGELPALDPGQQPVTVLSRLDGPGPLPARRPIAAMIDPPAASPPVATGDPAALAELDASDPAPAPLPAVSDQAESLTDAIIASLKGNPEIQISLAQQDDARYGVDEARANYLPRIDVTGAWGREFARNIPQAPTQRFRSEATIALNQNLWDFGVTINDIKRARASYRSAQWGTRERIEAISYDIASAYLGVLLQQNLVSLAEGEIASVKKILRIVTVQKDLGLTTPADVERAQTRLDNVRSQLLDRQSALEQARNAYKRLTNHMPLRAAEVPPAGTALPESADVAVDLIDTRSPRLAQAVEDRRSLDKQYDSQADTALPRLGLTIASDYRQDVLGMTGRAVDARAMVTFSYRLYNGGAATATKRRIGARLRQADYELDRRRREVEQDIRIDYASLGAAREKIATIEAEIGSAERVADLYKQQFRGGRRTVFDLLDAEQLLFAARAKQTANQIALRAAEYRVLQKLGGLFDLVSGGTPLPALAQPAPGSDD
ncbi:TolC family outer membrane protein [Novosphingobium sp. PASSN1]|uniref:TolC family outer membrane protein n=1 Tax=Novosphingobium sp. PASSN1 TaxID=2015561 RepID=UPI0025F1E3BC|nr:TolC family outer membrane protein [Novosphingobium sp. PASSN1]